MPLYKYTNSRGKTYIPHLQMQKLNNSDKEVALYFFAKDISSKGTPMEALPDGYEITENEHTGLPILRKIKPLPLNQISN